MGREKDFIIAIEDVLTPLAIRAGAISECSMHLGCYFYEGGDDADRRAYAMATNAWKDGEFGSASREQVLNAMKHVIEECPSGCVACEDVG